MLPYSPLQAMLPNMWQRLCRLQPRRLLQCLLKPLHPRGALRPLPPQGPTQEPEALRLRLRLHGALPLVCECLRVATEP